jgi:uncharacterized membrane protein YqjE
MHNQFNGRSIGGVVNELKDELKDFLQTRYQMLVSELREKTSALKIAAPLLVAALIFGWVAFLLFTLGLVGLVAVAFQGNPYQWPIAFGIVFVVWALIAGVCALFAISELKAQGFAPKKTLKVLKDDQVWLQSEARSQI